MQQKGAHLEHEGQEGEFVALEGRVAEQRCPQPQQVAHGNLIAVVEMRHSPCSRHALHHRPSVAPAHTIDVTALQQCSHALTPVFYVREAIAGTEHALGNT